MQQGQKHKFMFLFNYHSHTQATCRSFLANITALKLRHNQSTTKEQKKFYSIIYIICVM